MSLKTVALVLHQRPKVADLIHVEETISSFLGPAPYLSLCEACEFGSMDLLDWIWHSSCTSVHTRTSRWSLMNYLRSNPRYYSYQFSRSMEVAADRGDLETMEWLMTHFSGCVAAVEVVEVAVLKGNLEVLEFLLAHDAGQTKMRKVTTSEQNAREKYPRAGDNTNEVCWGSHQTMKLSIGNGRADIARWLHFNAPMDIEFQDEAIEDAIERGETELTKLLLPRGRCVLDYARFCSRPEIVEWMLDCGYYQRDQHGAASVLVDLVDKDHLDLVQRIADLEFVPRRNMSRWYSSWKQALQLACSRGSLPMTRFFMEHPTGVAMSQTENFEKLFALAASGGHFEVMQYLYGRGLVDGYESSFREALTKGRLNVAKWLIDNFPKHKRIPLNCIDSAAMSGDLETVEFLHNVELILKSGISVEETGSPTRQSGTPQPEIRQFTEPDRLDNLRKVAPPSWCSAAAMDNAAVHGHLNIVKWLHANRSEGCTANAMGRVAAAGHMEVVQWLKSNRSERWPSSALVFAAASGQLHVVRWLHENLHEGCMTSSMDFAAGGGHLELMKWLHTTRREGCTTLAIQTAVNYGHLRVVCWLQAHFPTLRYTPTGDTFSTNKFEMMLFVYEHWPAVFTADFVATSVRLQFDGSLKSYDKEVARWLREIQLHRVKGVSLTEL